MTAALEARVTLESDVDKVMQGSLPILDGALDIGHALALLKKHPAVLVSKAGKLQGILTKYDFVEEFTRR
jgi:predicted transcriptional regulator